MPPSVARHVANEGQRWPGLGRAEVGENRRSGVPFAVRRNLCLFCLVSVVGLSLGGSHLQIHRFVQTNEQ